MPQRWLILTSSTGSGHDTRAYALQAWAQERYGEAVRVDVWHVLEETSWVGAFGVWLYNSIQRQWPALHQVYWHIAEVWSLLNARFVPLVGRAVLDRFAADRPQLVISVHDSLNAPYFRAARRALGAQVRCATYCGEWSPGFGFSRHWIDPEVDLLIARSASVEREAQRRGVPRERTWTFRSLLRRRDFDPPMELVERQAFRVHELELDPERFTLLLATGALGADRHHRMLEALLPLSDQVQAIALCGRNQRARRRVETWSARHPELRVAVRGFTKEMPRYFQSADAVLTRGGSNTMAECVHFQRPVLFHAERGMMPQEYCTRRFLQEQGIGELVASPRALRAILKRWMSHPQEHAAIVQRFDGLGVDEHPHALVERLHRLAAEIG